MGESIDQRGGEASAWAPRWRFAGVDFDTHSGELRVKGELVTLERKPREMLRVFLKRPGELLTKSDLLDAVWSGRIVTDGALTNCIAKLRSAIDDPEGELLQTVHGYGYRLACAVQMLPQEKSTPLPDDEPSAQRPPGWQLERLLSRGPDIEIWEAWEPQVEEAGKLRRLKLARSGRGVDLLRREVTVSRYLYERLGTATPLPVVIEEHLEAAPFHIVLQGHADVGLREAFAQFACGDIAPMDGVLRLVEAVACLHSYGVVHGALSPDSFMLARDPVSGLRIGFAELGAAEARSGEPAAETAHVLEPSPYRAPELLAGAAPSLQSDTYALGVLAYQVLAGDMAHPMGPGWEARVGDVLLCQDIAAASQLDPAQRLSDAGELLRRLRNLEIRRARQQEEDQRRQRLALAERALQLARARRGPLLALAAVLVMGLVVTSWLAWSLRQAVAQERRSATVAAAVTEFLTKDLLAPANGSPGHAADVTIGTLLDRAAESLDARFAGQPLMHASLQRVLGTSYAALIQQEKAVPLLLSAEAALAEQLGPAAVETEATRLALQELLVNLPLTPSRMEGMEAVAQRQYDAEAAAGHPHPEVGFIARVALDSIRCWRRTGIIRGGNCGGAIDSVLEDARKRLGPGHPLVLRISHSRASLVGVAGNPDEALTEFERVLDGLERIHGHGSPKLTLLFLQMSKGLEYGGEPARVIPLLQRAILNFSSSFGDSHPYLWNARRALGVAYTNAGRHTDAIALQRQQLDTVTARYGHHSRERLTALRFLAQAEVAGGDAEAALLRIQEGLALERQVEADPYDRYELQNLQALILAGRHQWSQAEEVLRQLVRAVSVEAPGADVPLGRYELHRARMLLALQRPGEARIASRQALEHLRRVLPPGAPLVIEAQRVSRAAGGGI
ncbi:winged helix-turn-helix domain-containing protein [Solimonas sp. SE-A11]|uniref:winged helix-turn-helix domain-containing protein n=1 Tax=Solimonas sp. SE-A11 TaxID=3054954 RepID=UPI00259D2DD7|nr:winged helix-turn-helix domain-containing protein [Solimonas sp. SE-A11]MDM4772252.1 winged helix-turn-helix domain-containing protein [Solimonas sp. SE-A11]